MTEYKEDEFLMLSGIQHFTFCRRQWALIHIEQQWEENLRTVEGNIMHNRAHDNALTECRGDLLVSRGIAVFSRSLGISGVCDVVEFHKNKKGVQLYGREGSYKVVPVEYKKGAPKNHDADTLQLTAQAMCLEEMLLCDIPVGYLYYGETRRRSKVEITEGLRNQVRQCCQEMHELYDRRYTPKVKTTKACNACSLKNLCLPKLCRNKSAKDYIKKYIEESEPG